MSIAQALGGGALLLNSLLSSIRVDGGHNDDTGLIDQLGVGNGEGIITGMGDTNTVSTGTGFLSRKKYARDWTQS